MPLGWLTAETDDGMERGVEIIGPAESGKAEQMRVRFPDGTEDDWDEEDFQLRDPKLEPKPEPEPGPAPKAALADGERVLDKKARKKLEKLRKKEAKEAERERKLELKQQKKNKNKGKR